MNSLTDAQVANKFCELSNQYMNHLLYDTCNIDLNKIKYILLLRFIQQSKCKDYYTNCLEEKLSIVLS